jgi:hypothetical protein
MCIVTLRINNFDLPIDYSNIPEIPNDIAATFSAIAQENFPQNRSLRVVVKELHEMGPELSFFEEKAYAVAEIAGVMLGAVAACFILAKTLILAAVATSIVAVTLLSVGVYAIYTDNQRKVCRRDVQRLCQLQMNYFEKHKAKLREKVDFDYQKVLNEQGIIFKLDPNGWPRFMLSFEVQRVMQIKEVFEASSSYFDTLHLLSH